MVLNTSLFIGILVEIDKKPYQTTTFDTLNIQLQFTENIKTQEKVYALANHFVRGNKC